MNSSANLFFILTVADRVTLVQEMSVLQAVL